MAIDFQTTKQTNKEPVKIDFLPKTQTDNRSIFEKAASGVSGFANDLFRGITEPIVQSVAQVPMAIKTIENASKAKEYEKQAKEQIKGTDALLKALKTAKTDEEKKSITNAIQARLSGLQKEDTMPIKDTSVTLPYYGKLKAPTTLKQVAGTGIETIAAGVGGEVKGVGALAKLSKAIGPGAKIGTLYGAGSALKEDKSMGEAAKRAIIGGVTGKAADLALRYGGKQLSKLGENIKKSRATAAAKKAAQSDELVGKIIQGKTKQKASGKIALKELGSEGIKTYSDIKEKIIKKIPELAKKVDKELEKDTNLYKLKDLATKEKSIGGKTVETNYVETVLKHLKEMYEKTGDKVAAQNAAESLAKAKTVGISRKEINNLARAYNVEFGKKAFSKSGEALTSVNAKMYQNIRSGIKEVAREGFGGTKAAAFDKKLSAIYDIQNIINRNVEEVNKLQQKIQKRGLGEQVGRKGFDAMNTVTGGGLKGFIERGMGRGTGLKTLNYLELEKNLAKNLKLLEKANKATTNEGLLKVLEKLGSGMVTSGKAISAIPGAAETLPQKEVSVLAQKLGQKAPIGMTIKDVSKGFSKAGVPQKLEQEARKYKSAEEFVKAQGTPVYHGSDKLFTSTDEIKFGDDVFYTLKRTDGELKELAESASPDNYWSYDDLAKMPANAFGKEVSEFIVNFKNPKIVDAKGKGWMELTDGSMSDWTNKIVQQATKSGKKYDGIIIKNIEEGFSGKGTLGASAGLVDDYIVLNKSAIKTKSQLTDIWNKANQKETLYKETGSLTTKLLKKLEGKTTVNKQFISDLTNSPDLKQTEKDLIRAALKGEDSKINVTKFANKVKAELLPLKVKTNPNGTRYENITLPEEIRGNVKNYDEHIFESPIKTSAGDTHFGGSSDKYFGHTRIEDMADNKTRRVIEVQSDLYQKGGLEKESGDIFRQAKQENETFGMIARRLGGGDEIKGSKIAMQKNTEELSKLRQYNDPTAHFRMVREEIAQAAKDKKTKVQFPTGETAMKIEGLGQGTNVWKINEGGKRVDLTPEKLKVGETIAGPAGDFNTDGWIITDVLGDGKFKAVQKSFYERATSKLEVIKDTTTGGEEIYLVKNTNTGEVLRPSGEKTLKRAMEFVEQWKKESVDNLSETFDISGKVDKENPIYKFYEKDLGKYLKNKYNAKEVIDDQGVSWYEVDIKPEMKGSIEAFGMAALPGIQELLNNKNKKQQ